MHDPAPALRAPRARLPLPAYLLLLAVAFIVGLAATALGVRAATGSWVLDPGATTPAVAPAPEGALPTVEC